MAQHPFLKSIRPVNLLSFGPNTEEIELRPLNILIGPNGCGKSNFIEVLGLLSKLPDKDPWSTVIETGGSREWTWKGKNAESKPPSLTVITTPEALSMFSGRDGEKSLFYTIALRARDGAFEVATERFLETDDNEDGTSAKSSAFDRHTGLTPAYAGAWPNGSSEQAPNIPPGRSVLSMVSNVSNFPLQPRMREFAFGIEQFSFYRDWAFGGGSKTRALQPSGFDSYRLAADSINLAQVLKAMRDRGDQTVFDQLLELLRKFYEPVKDVDTELLGTYLRIMIKEEGLSSRTPAERLSDGTLRWLMLLIVLLDPAPPSVICIDEPELGLHPDIIPTLADLLVEASTRTQLIVTTHSDSLIDAFTETPEVVCVCEKIEGSTVIRRLDQERLKIWLEDYSLGKLWASGEIGGNRW